MLKNSDKLTKAAEIELHFPWICITFDKMDKKIDCWIQIFPFD